MECRQAANRKRCTCTYEPCSRKGICCECIAYHRARKEAPGCLFQPAAEKTYDRSVENLIKAQGR